MEQHDLLPHAPFSLSLSSPLLHPSALYSLNLQRKKKNKTSPLPVPAEQLQGRETQMEMFVENNMCIIKV